MPLINRYLIILASFPSQMMVVGAACTGIFQSIWPVCSQGAVPRVFCCHLLLKSPTLAWSIFSQKSFPSKDFHNLDLVFASCLLPPQLFPLFSFFLKYSKNIDLKTYSQTWKLSIVSCFPKSLRIKYNPLPRAELAFPSRGSHILPHAIPVS